MTIGFYGAAGEVTGSNFVLTTEKAKIMIDCGMFQGRKLAEEANYAPFAYELKEISALILTHAHLDHCGRIPKLWKEGFRGKIYATPATRDLAELIMTDAANIMLFDSEDDGDDPLYLQVDVANAMSLFEPVDYHKKTEVAPGVSFEFIDAGHILGAASAIVEADGKKIVFSGDIGNSPVPILRDPETPTEADVVVMETTYGSRIHETAKDRRVKLRTVIKRIADQNGTLVIPSFALERTQELLYELSALMQEATIPSVPVFLDSPLAIKITDVYYNYPQYYDDEAVLIRKNGGDFLSFPTLKITESADQSKHIKEVKGAKIIIAGSGMMEGGRIIHHAKEFLKDANNMLLFVGYQAVGTLGRQLFDGLRRVKVKDQFVSVKAHVAAIGAYSGHADQPALEHWVSSIKEKPKQIFLVHGEEEGAEAFAEKLGKEYTTTIPTNGDVVEI